MEASSRPRNLLATPASRWRQALSDLGIEAYRGDQIARWVFGSQVFDLQSMTDLPVQLRRTLPERICVTVPSIDQVFTSVDHSRRYLLRIADGGVVEAVSMPYAGRVTLCISSQLGCRFACTFCQTGRQRLGRSLTVEEIVGQVLRLRADGPESARRINVVFMGQGEPLDNLDAVVGACEALQDPAGPALGWRRLTVSTVGLPPGLRRLQAMGGARPRIAVSLNATTDEVRSSLMPVNRKFPIATLLGELRGIAWRPREKVTFEYVLLSGVNDTPEDAVRLGTLLRALPAKVNLIPWNPVDGMPFDRPSPPAVEQFRALARRSGLDVLVRYSRGADIGAACGQLQAAARIP